MLLIYRLRNIPHFNDMIRYWNTRAREDGFQGLFIVSMNVCREHVAKSIWVDGSVDFEPNRTKSERLGTESAAAPKEKGGWLWNRFAVKAIQYDAINREMLRTPHEKNHFRTVFVDYDDSPRRGTRAVVTRGSAPEKFGRYLRAALRQSREEGNGYVFLNAWNEWGEGMYLEPDETHQYGYLEALRRAVVECKDEKEQIDSINFCMNFYTDEELLWKKRLQKSSRYSTLLHNWLCLKEHSVDFSLYFQKYGYHRIAIYGMGRLGVHLLNELCGKNVTVCFGIDKNNECIDCEMNVYNPSQPIPEVDAVVITVICQYRQISDNLRNKICCPIITIEEVIQELMLL